MPNALWRIGGGATKDGTATSSLATASLSLSPTPGGLLVAHVSSTISGGAPAAPTVSGSFGVGAVWTKTYDFQFNGAGGANDTRLTVWRCLVPAGSPSGAITADWAGVNQTTCHIIVGEYTKTAVTGTNASDAFPVAQANLQTAAGTGTSASVTLAALKNANSLAVGFMAHNQSEAITAGSGYTVRSNSFNTAPSISVEDKSNTTTANATWATSRPYGFIGYELAAAWETLTPITASSTTYSTEGRADSTTVFEVRPDGAGNIKIAKSTDGGASWGADVTVGSGDDIPLDVPLVWDPATDRLHCLYVLNHDSASLPAQLKYRYSDDHAATWSGEQTLDNGVSHGNNRFYRVSLTAYNGVINVVYTSDNVTTSSTDGLFQMRNTSGGASGSWSAATAIFVSSPATPLRPVMFREGASTIHLWWYATGTSSGADPGDAYYGKSTDGGASWGSPVRLTTSTDIGRPVGAVSNGVATCVFMKPFGPGILCDVYDVQSIDDGATWGAPTLLQAHSGSTYGLTHPFVAQKGNLICVGWCDRANSQLVTVVSADGGASWGPATVAVDYGVANVADAPRIIPTQGYFLASGYDNAIRLARINATATTNQAVTAAAVAATATLQRQTSKTVAAAAACTATIRKQTSKTLAATAVACTATLQAAKTILKTLTATAVAVSGSLIAGAVTFITKSFSSPTPSEYDDFDSPNQRMS